MAGVMRADRRTLVEFAAAVAGNGRRLLADAEYLLEGGRWPSAFAVAGLACEEFGKVPGVLALAMIPAGLRSKARPGKLLRDHEAKMTGALLTQLVSFGVEPGVGARLAGMDDLEGALGKVQADSASSSQAKLSGLYADLDASGRIRVPEEEISEGQARSAVERARDVARSWVLLDDPEGLERLADPPKEALDLLMPLFIETADSVPADAGPEELAPAVQGFAQRVQQLIQDAQSQAGEDTTGPESPDPGL